MARTEIAKKVYVDGEGNESRSVPEGVDRLEFRFGDGTVETVRPADFPESVQVAAMWHGFAQKIGDAYSGAKGDVAAAIESATEAIGDLLEGNWVTQREGGGPRSSQLALAFAAAMRANGHELTDEDAIAKVATWDKDKKKEAAAMPAIAAELARIKAEAAAEKAKKLAEAAQADTGTGLTDL